MWLNLINPTPVIMKLQLLILCLVISYYITNPQSFNILKYGAIGDGKTLNTEAVQKAIDDCNLNGGGTVIVPTKSIYKNNVK